MRRLPAVVVIMTLALSVVPLRADAGRSSLQRDADVVHAVGVTGVIARQTTTSGRTRTVASGVGELGGRPPRKDGQFRIGSTNKALVATVVLQLVAERRMLLDDVVLAWLMGGELSIIPLVGASSVAQLDETLASVDLELTTDQRHRLDAAGQN
ncbi:aldo/keto reductase [Kribbella sp. NPDC003505]|uniref:aldo/keto reductase n=1 Tax=Kribbella sp. NPDC003505 TaxID=3154448 RepID=UPI0033B12EB9